MRSSISTSLLSSLDQASMEDVPFFLDISVCCFWSEIRANPSRCVLIHFSICLLAYLSTVKQIYEFQFTLWNRSDSPTCLFVLFVHSQFHTFTDFNSLSKSLKLVSHVFDLLSEACFTFGFFSLSFFKMVEFSEFNFSFRTELHLNF